jgi:hypothetical protein
LGLRRRRGLIQADVRGPPRAAEIPILDTEDVDDLEDAPGNEVTVAEEEVLDIPRHLVVWPMPVAVV